MPDRKKLKIGDKIRILSVPESDIKQRRIEIAEGKDNPGWTADIIELIISQNPIVKIDEIDDFGQPWFSCDLMVNGKPEQHTLAIMEDSSWELA